MVRNPPEGCQRIIPYLIYENAAEAIAFLTEAFGFVERFRLPGSEGAIGHAELAYQDNIVMLADLASALQAHGGDAKELPGRRCMTCVYVDDVDSHHARAKAAGAILQGEPEDQFYGDRTYRAVDMDGHQWFFHQHVKDIAPEDMKECGG